MQSFLTKRSKIKLKVLAWYQITGGVLGVLLSFWFFARTDQISGLLLAVYLVAFGLYAYSIYCGWLLLTDKYSKGLNLSILNQAMQILSFTVFGYGFMYVAGIMILGDIKVADGFNIGVNFSLTSTWRIFLDSDDRSIEIAINFFAIYLIYFTNKLHTTIKQEKRTYEEEQLAQVNPPLSNE